MSNKFYLVKIGTVYLTDDATGLGAECKTEIEGLQDLFLAHTGSTTKAVDGTANTFLRENDGKGVDIITRPFVVEQDVLDDLKAVIDTANTAGSTINVVISNASRTFDVECRPLFVDRQPPLRFSSKFRGSRQYDVVVALTVDSINP